MSSQAGSRKRRISIPPIEYDAGGTLLCRWCRGPVEGRGVYCSQECRDSFLIRHSPEYAGQRYRALIGHRCVGCGADEQGCFARYKQAAVLLSETPAEALLLPFELWQMDHIRPVADGGGECGLENFRLLCPLCHGGVTHVFLKDLLSRKKSASPWQARMRSEQGYRRRLPPRRER